MLIRVWVAIAAIVLCAAAFLIGRSSASGHRVLAKASFDAGYLAGREAAFAGYDGGWAYGTPYVVTLQRGGPGITYRVAHRSPLLPGLSYRLCGHAVCASTTR